MSLDLIVMGGVVGEEVVVTSSDFDVVAGRGGRGGGGEGGEGG